MDSRRTSEEALIVQSGSITSGSSKGSPRMRNVSNWVSLIAMILLLSTIVFVAYKVYSEMSTSYSSSGQAIMMEEASRMPQYRSSKVTPTTNPSIIVSPSQRSPTIFSRIITTPAKKVIRTTEPTTTMTMSDSHYITRRWGMRNAIKVTTMELSVSTKSSIRIPSRISSPLTSPSSSLTSSPIATSSSLIATSSSPIPIVSSTPTLTLRTKASSPLSTSPMPIAPPSPTALSTRTSQNVGISSTPQIQSQMVTLSSKTTPIIRPQSLPKVYHTSSVTIPFAPPTTAAPRRQSPKTKPANRRKHHGSDKHSYRHKSGHYVTYYHHH